MTKVQKVFFHSSRKLRKPKRYSEDDLPLEQGVGITNPAQKSIIEKESEEKLFHKIT